MTRPNFPELPFDTFGPQLRDLMTATANKLDREWPGKWRDLPQAQVLLEASVRVSQNTYASILHLIAEHPRDPLRRKEYALSVPPLTRSILDSLFTVVFVLDDLPLRSRWYFKGGWRELVEEQERLVAEYGADPDWQEWLDERSKHIDNARSVWGITEAEAANPKAIRYWPIPGQMLRDRTTSEDRRAFLQYLDDWHYKALSQQAHLSWSGLALRSAALIPDQDEEARAWRLEKQTSDAFLTTVCVMLALLSEIELAFRYGLDERLKYVWGVVNGYFGICEELYRKRYADVL